ncbi:MAG: acetyl-CoA hydrolase/transferase C-terminal domain-containing protein, partial [Pseudomonadota bacterium]
RPEPWMPAADLYADLFRRLAPGDRVYLAGATGQPSAALEALRTAPDAARGLVFTGVWLPGVNDVDPTAGVAEASADVFFVGAGQREGFAAGRIRHLPLHYWDAERWLAGPARLKAAALTVTAPQNGAVTPGLASDFHPALLDAGAALIGEINPNMPVPPGAPRIPVERFAALIEPETPADLPVFETGAVPADLAAIAERIAARIGPGDCLQIGIGKAAAAVLQALQGRRGLRYHAGLVIDAMVPHLEAGTFSEGVTTGTALGGPALYAAAGRAETIEWRPVRHTHDVRAIAAVPRFKAVNSALEIDLFGQSNGETLRGRQISGSGGSVDFQRGARASDGGEAILALPATAGGGKVSRIKPRLEPISIASIQRADADVVATEHGVAELRWKGVDARAEALIAVAAPEFRDDLANAWDALRRAM